MPKFVSKFSYAMQMKFSFLKAVVVMPLRSSAIFAKANSSKKPIKEHIDLRKHSEATVRVTFNQAMTSFLSSDPALKLL